MSENVRLGDGVVDEAKAEANNRIKELVKMSVNMFFDYLESQMKDLPDTIKRLRNNPELEQKVETLWSEQLFEEGLIPKGYSGLPDKLLIDNLHQTGYLDGLYVGYALAMMAMVDNNADEDLILAARDYIRPNLMGHHLMIETSLSANIKTKNIAGLKKANDDHAFLRISLWI